MNLTKTGFNLNMKKYNFRYKVKHLGNFILPGKLGVDHVHIGYLQTQIYRKRKDDFDSSLSCATYMKRFSWTSSEHHIQ